MEVKIDALIEKVKQNGIAEGKKHAEQIISDAKVHADTIIKEAHSEAHVILENSKAEAQMIEKRGKDALVQAHRDLLLVVKDELSKLLSVFLSQKTRDVLQGDSLQSIIIQALSQWQLGDDNNIFLSLSVDDAKNITQSAIEGIVQQNGGKISIQPKADITAGFMVSREKDGALKFNFTDKTISESLTSFLTPTLQEILR